MIWTIVILALGAILAVYSVGIYNDLVALRENVKVTWANIDVLLKQRHDELPKLIETCKRYMRYEQETLEKVMRARASVSSASTSGDIAAVGAAERQLRAGIGRLFAVAENYPQLKADESFRQLQARITALEESIADRRELYNDQVNINNIRVSTFPDALIARRFGFASAQLLEFSEPEKRDVDVGVLFGTDVSPRDLMPRIKLWLIVAGLAAASIYCFRYACKAWIENRLIADTPTSRVRSAAQGYVALCGRGLSAEDGVNRGPLTGLPCTWWRYKIEERSYTGRSRSWCTVDGDTSAVPFLLDDGTGRCLVDPRGAEVYPASTIRWYGPSPWPQGRIPDGTGVFGWLVDTFVTDKYRYTEYHLEPNQQVYSIGLFRSLGGVHVDDGEAAVTALLHDWKEDRAGLLARFDTDRDGNISSGEWEQARAAARLQVEKERAAEERRPTMSVLADPMDGRRFLLAAFAGESLARRLRRRVLAGAGGFVAGSAALTWVLEHV